MSRVDKVPDFRTNASAERAVERGSQLTELLSEHTRVLHLLDTTAALRDLARMMREGCGAHIGLAGPIEAERLLVLRQWDGTRATGLHDLHVPMGLGLGGLAYAKTHPVWVLDYRSSPLITHDFDNAISADGIKTMLAVPMVRGGQTYGVVYAALREAREISDRVLDTATRIADDGAIALQTAATARRQREAATRAERRRIAAALHDSVGAQLFRIGSELRDLRTTAAHGHTELVDQLLRLEKQLAQTASAFRESVQALNQQEPSQSLTATLSNDCAEFQRRTGVEAQTLEIGALPECDEHRAKAIIAVVREALLNVEKHANADSVLVSLLPMDGGIAVSVADDGTGWGESTAASGIGMQTMRDRVEAVGGTFSVVTNEDGGITVRVWMPVA